MQSLSIWVLFGICVLEFGFLPLAVHAALLPDCNPVPGTSNTCGVNHLLELVVNIYNFLLGLAALVAMLFIVWGGVRMLYFSYLEDSAHELESAKLTVRRAVGGFIIIALAYLGVNTALTMLGVVSTGKGSAGWILQQWGLF